MFAVVPMLAALLLAQVAPSPTPQPSPSASPAPATKSVQFDEIGSFTGIFTQNVNPSGSLDSTTGIDRIARTEPANLLFTAVKNTGQFQFAVTAGLYTFPVVGAAGNGILTPQTNTNLFCPVPSAYVEYVPGATATASGNFSIMAGKLPTLLGTESMFTYQNAFIQRGIGWNVEPVISRGVRLNGTSGLFSASIELNDGFYTARYNSLEGVLTFAPSSSASVSFAFLLPPANAIPNPTAGIANKREYNPMFSYTASRWALQPYAVFVTSPANASLGYTRSESANVFAVPLSYALDSHWSLGGRFEYGLNGSTASDTSANANILGFGPGSTVQTYTLTPGYKNGALFARAEFSEVTIANGIPGLGFGLTGNDPVQFRVAAELGLKY